MVDRSMWQSLTGMESSFDFAGTHGRGARAGGAGRRGQGSLRRSNLPRSGPLHALRRASRCCCGNRAGDDSWFRFSNCAVTRDFATASDGARLPVTIISRRDVKQDGTAPLLVWGYGGYGNVESPVSLSPATRIWLDAGGVYALANLRLKRNRGAGQQLVYPRSLRAPAILVGCAFPRSASSLAEVIAILLRTSLAEGPSHRLGGGLLRRRDPDRVLRVCAPPLSR
jgi:hypothetical protein